MSNPPRLLLLDEPPLSALDPSARVEVAGVLERIKRRKGITMVITTHDVNPPSSKSGTGLCSSARGS